jgi:hypothetical protein
MKAIYLLLFLVLIDCNNSSAEKNESRIKLKKATISEEKTDMPQSDGIVGDWKLVLEAYDGNGNHLLDEAERKKAIANHYFYRFSTDGSCIISPFANNQLKSGFKGKYQVADKNGKKIITTYWDEADQKGKKEAQYTIISVNKDELVFLETTGNHTFWIFKRV